MANSTIPGLVAVTVPALTDLFGVRQSGDTRDKKLTAAQLKTLFGGVSITGTPANLQVAFWNPDGTAITGNVGLTFDTAALRNLAAGGAIRGGLSNAGGIRNVASSSTVPTLIPRMDDLSTGIGSGAIRNVSVTCDGDFAQTWQHSTAADNSIRQFVRITTGVTASTTQTQGNGLINGGRFTEVTTVANPDDVITLHNTSAAGFHITIMNSGANQLQIFPPVGETILGNAVNASVTLAVNKSMTFYTLDSTNWMIVSEPGAGASFPSLAPDGTVGAPSYSFSGDPDTGIWKAGLGQIDFAINGTNAVKITGDSIRAPNGSPTLTAFGFLSDITTGFYRVGAGRVGLSSAGSLTWNFDGADIFGQATTGPALSNVSSTATAANIHPNKGDQDTGLGSNAADQLSLIAGGLELLRLTEATVDQVIIGPAGVIGTAALPSLAWGDGDTGFYETVDDSLTLSIAGAQAWFWSGVSFGGTLSNGPAFVNEVPSATNPTVIPGRSDPDTGIGWNAANEFSLIAGGVEHLRLSAASNAFMLAGTVASGDGGDLDLDAGASGTVAADAGGAVSITAGASNAGGAGGLGGALSLLSGAGSGVADGGDINITTGDGGAGGVGGDLIMQVGLGGGTAASGNWFVNTLTGIGADGGSVAGTSTAGLVAIYGAGHSAEGQAGNVDIWGGYAAGTTAAAIGGDLNLFGGGQGGGAGSGGNAHLYGGESDTQPGDAEVEGGVATVGGAGGAARVLVVPGLAQIKMVA